MVGKNKISGFGGLIIKIPTKGDNLEIKEIINSYLNR